MVCLALAGSFVAGAHYVIVDLPQQQTLSQPVNYIGSCWSDCQQQARECFARCDSADLSEYKRWWCNRDCGNICDDQCGTMQR
jgi:hypothetical protein